MTDVDPLAVQLLLILVLVLVNAVLAGSEIALVSLREAQLGRLEGVGRSGRTLARLARDPNRFMAAVQIGITLTGFLASATAAVTLAEPLVGALAPLGQAARPVAVLLVVLALTFVTLVAGELAPKRLAMQQAERWGLLVAQPLAALATVTRPVIWLLGRATDLLVRLLGGDPTARREEVSEEDLRGMVATQPQLSPQERGLIEGAFEFADRRLRQILVPRTDLLALPGGIPADEGLRRLVAGGHSRAPVYEDGLDDVIGVVHLRDLVDGGGTVRAHARPALTLPESARALHALRAMQGAHQQLALVISEYGGVEGLVTVEDLVEELVGEIWDETDEDVRAVERHGDGSLSVSGAYPIHDLEDIGVELPAGDYTTVAGLILDRLGRIPAPGQELSVRGWRLRVEGATSRAITKVRLSAATNRSRTAGWHGDA